MSQKIRKTFWKVSPKMISSPCLACSTWPTDEKSRNRFVVLAQNSELDGAGPWSYSSKFTLFKKIKIKSAMMRWFYCYSVYTVAIKIFDIHFKLKVFTQLKRKKCMSWCLIRYVFKLIDHCKTHFEYNISSRSCIRCIIIHLYILRSHKQ